MKERKEKKENKRGKRERKERGGSKRHKMYNFQVTGTLARPMQGG